MTTNGSILDGLPRGLADVSPIRKAFASGETILCWLQSAMGLENELPDGKTPLTHWTPIPEPPE